MDKFFSQRNCDRCKGDLTNGRIMSMFNEQVLCMKCKDLETKDEDYKKAVQADNDEIKKGNYNFRGIRGKDK